METRDKNNYLLLEEVRELVLKTLKSLATDFAGVATTIQTSENSLKNQIIHSNSVDNNTMEERLKNYNYTQFQTINSQLVDDAQDLVLIKNNLGQILDYIGVFSDSTISSKLDIIISKLDELQTTISNLS